MTTAPPIITAALVDLARRKRLKPTAADYTTWINAVLRRLGDIAEAHNYSTPTTVRGRVLDLAATALTYAEHIDRQDSHPGEQWATLTTGPTGLLLLSSVLTVAGQWVVVPELVQLDSGHRTSLGPVRVGAALRALGHEHADDWRERCVTVPGVELFPVVPHVPDAAVLADGQLTRVDGRTGEPVESGKDTDQ